MYEGVGDIPPSPLLMFCGAGTGRGERTEDIPVVEVEQAETYWDAQVTDVGAIEQTSLGLHSNITK